MLAGTKPRVPIYRYHKLSGLASVRIEGRDIYLGRHGTPESREGYRRVISEWLANHKVAAPNARLATPPNDPIVDALILAYLTFAKGYYVKNGEPAGEYKNIGEALAPLTQLYGKTCVVDFGPSAHKAVRQAMIDSNLCRGTINSRINRVRRLFKWGVENEMVPPRMAYSLDVCSSNLLIHLDLREAYVR